MTSASKPSVPDASVLNILVGSHRRFLAFLTPRVKAPQDAEEILQAAFGKVIESQPSVDEEMAIPWFFRLLRNALTDYYRRNAAEQRALDNRLAAMDEACEAELERTVCQCLSELIPTLKREYAELLVRIDLGGGSVQETAVELGITANNASVRLHRARLALKGRLEQICRTCASHGCFDCSCKDC